MPARPASPRARLFPRGAALLAPFLLAACAAGETGGGSGGSSTGDPPCAAGHVVCDGNTARTCDGKGGSSSDTDCVDHACSDGLGCVACAPEAGSCSEGVGRACGANGLFYSFACDPDQGMDCQPDGCKGACSPAVLGSSYLGCEYWPTVTMNGVLGGSFAFAVALGSTSPEPTAITIEGPDFSFGTQLLPYEVKTLNLPWVASLKGPDFGLGNGQLLSVAPTENTTGQAYRVRTDHPVAAYQFNPLQYQNADPPASCPSAQFGGCFSFSNDASLLLPTNALARSYYVVGYRTVFVGDFLVITATHDATTVTLHAGPHTRSLAGAGVALIPNESATISMNRGDVVQLFSKGTSATQTWSGSTVTASAPVQVLTGAPCATISDGLIACDHLEDSVLPAETLGRHYAVTVPRTPTPLAGTPHGGRHLVRIHGLHDGTALTFHPANLSSKTTVDAGEVIELPGVEEDFVVDGNAAFAVTHYMIGQGDPAKPADGGAGAGDPSQAMAIPVEQFRKDYTFIAPESFDVGFVNVVADIGTAVEVDGTVLTGSDWTPIADSGKAVARHKLTPTPYHRATSNQPFGVVVYAYGQYTSYMYAAGLDLAKIEAPVPE